MARITFSAAGDMRKVFIVRDISLQFDPRAQAWRTMVSFDEAVRICWNGDAERWRRYNDDHWEEYQNGSWVDL